MQYDYMIAINSSAHRDQLRAIRYDDDQYSLDVLSLGQLYFNRFKAPHLAKITRKGLFLTQLSKVLSQCLKI